jgi:hypothetical protein
VKQKLPRVTYTQHLGGKSNLNLGLLVPWISLYFSPIVYNPLGHQFILLDWMQVSSGVILSPGGHVFNFLFSSDEFSHNSAPVSAYLLDIYTFSQIGCRWDVGQDMGYLGPCGGHLIKILKFKLQTTANIQIAN